jgi:hypothetical protein
MCIVQGNRAYTHPVNSLPQFINSGTGLGFISLELNITK